MSIEFPFNFDEHVYYVSINGLEKKTYVREGNVFGYTVYKRKGKLDIRINFRNDNGIEVRFVSRDKAEIEKKVAEINEQLSRVRL